MNHHVESRPVVLLGFALFFGVLLAGCGTTELAGRWNEGLIRVDADLNDWADSTAFVKEKKLRVGISNDRDFLYVALFATNA
ncbi:MAG: hypothetical protein EPO30_11320, partial [Lysobacteraceae bacterium]